MYDTSKYDELFGSSKFKLSEVFNLDLVIQTRKSFGEYESIHKGHFGFICKHCNTPGIMYINKYIYIEHTGKRLKRETIHHSTYDITCPNCGITETYDYLLDPAITPTISMLNIKGYTTTHSCQGHGEQLKEWLLKEKTKNTQTYKNFNSEAYIAFKLGSMHSKVLDLYPLPSIWSYNPAEELDKNSVIIRTSNSPTQNDMCEIYDWACKLPDISRGALVAKIAEIMEELENIPHTNFGYYL